MTNPFDDLESTENDTDPVESVSESDSEQPSSSADPSAESTSPADSGPAFEYSEVRQRPLYAREKTWDEFEDALGITVTPELRKAGIRDEETREVHDAVLRLAAEEPERIAELIEEARS